MKTLGFAILGIILALLSYLAWSDRASAANMSEMTTASGARYIAFWGEIVEGDSDRLEALLESTGIDRVAVSSPGGSANEGISLGELMREREVVVAVPQGGICLSACAIMFTGAKEQILYGIVGFHVAWTSEAMSPSSAMQGGQYFGLVGAAHFMENGYSLVLPYIITVATSPDTFLVFTDLNDLEKFRVGKDLPVSNYLKALDWVTREWVNLHLADSNRIRELAGG